MVNLDELMRLHAAATPRPWSVKIGDFEAEDGYGTVSASYVEADGKTICVPFDRGPDDENDEDDTAYIVAACNAVPELVARIRELEAELSVTKTTQVSALEPCRIVSNNNSTPPEWLMRRFTEVN